MNTSVQWLPPNHWHVLSHNANGGVKWIVSEIVVFAATNTVLVHVAAWLVNQKQPMNSWKVWLLCSVVQLWFQSTDWRVWRQQGLKTASPWKSCPRHSECPWKKWEVLFMMARSLLDSSLLLLLLLLFFLLRLSSDGPRAPGTTYLSWPLFLAHWCLRITIFWMIALICISVKMWCLITLIFSVLLQFVLCGLPSFRSSRWRGGRVARASGGRLSRLLISHTLHI